jgi:hypothetical protein
MNHFKKYACRTSFPSNGGVGIRIVWILLSLMIITLAIIFLISNQQKDQARYSRKAMEISEYGLMCVLETLGKKPSWSDGFLKIPYDDGWYSAKLNRRMKGDTLFCTVEAIGHIGTVTKKSGCRLRLSIVNGDSVWQRSDGR